MARSESVTCNGERFTVEWCNAANGRCQAREYYNALVVEDRAKALALFQRMAAFGKIYDTEKFNQESDKLYVFKPQPHRFFCFFVRGRRILVVAAYQKQGQRAPRREIDRAESVRQSWLARVEERGHGEEKDR